MDATNKVIHFFFLTKSNKVKQLAQEYVESIISYACKVDLRKRLEVKLRSNRTKIKSKLRKVSETWLQILVVETNNIT